MKFASIALIGILACTVTAANALTPEELAYMKKYEPQRLEHWKDLSKKYGSGNLSGKRTYAFCLRRGRAQGYTQPGLGRGCMMNGFNE